MLVFLVVLIFFVGLISIVNSQYPNFFKLFILMVSLLFFLCTVIFFTIGNCNVFGLIGLSFVGMECLVIVFMFRENLFWFLVIIDRVLIRMYFIRGFSGNRISGEISWLQLYIVCFLFYIFSLFLVSLLIFGLIIALIGASSSVAFFDVITFLIFCKLSDYDNYYTRFERSRKLVLLITVDSIRWQKAKMVNGELVKGHWVLEEGARSKFVLTNKPILTFSDKTKLSFSRVMEEFLLQYPREKDKSISDIYTLKFLESQLVYSYYLDRGIFVDDDNPGGTVDVFEVTRYRYFHSLLSISDIILVRVQLLLCYCLLGYNYNDNNLFVFTSILKFIKVSGLTYKERLVVFERELGKLELVYARSVYKSVARLEGTYSTISSEVVTWSEHLVLYHVNEGRSFVAQYEKEFKYNQILWFESRFIRRKDGEYEDNTPLRAPTISVQEKARQYRAAYLKHRDKYIRDYQFVNVETISNLIDFVVRDLFHGYNLSVADRRSLRSQRKLTEAADLLLFVAATEMSMLNLLVYKDKIVASKGVCSYMGLISDNFHATNTIKSTWDRDLSWWEKTVVLGCYVRFVHMCEVSVSSSLSRFYSFRSNFNIKGFYGYLYIHDSKKVESNYKWARLLGDKRYDNTRWRVLDKQLNDALSQYFSRVESDIEECSLYLKQQAGYLGIEDSEVDRVLLSFKRVMYINTIKYLEGEYFFRENMIVMYSGIFPGFKRRDDSELPSKSLCRKPAEDEDISS